MLQKTPMEVTPAPVEQVRQWLEANDLLLVDVREPLEFEKEHIAGAMLLPLSSFDPELFPALNGKRVVLYCAIGKRSEAAGKMLLKEGHSDVIHMDGGLKAWKAAGYETEEALPPSLEKTTQPVFLCPAPGAVLHDEYLEPLNIAPAVLAEKIGISEKTIAALLRGEVAVNAEMSLRLARFFSTAGDFWLRLQSEHDLERARHALGERIRREIAPRTAGAGC